MRRETFLHSRSVHVDITERKRAEEALSTVNQRLIEAQEEERTRLARELHDDINQRVALLALKLQILQESLPAPVAEIRHAIAEASKDTEGLGGDIHALSHRLHSSKLEILGLATAAGGFCRELSDRIGIEIGFHSESIPKDLPREISLCLFRVLQEALQNAIKHSGSRDFQVSLSGGSSVVELTVRDSGIGFDPEDATRGNGLGLTSIRERLKLVNGKLFIDSQSQRGTTILARVPLSPKMKSAAAP
jgi:signal transduction histidine kinase